MSTYLRTASRWLADWLVYKVIGKINQEAFVRTQRRQLREKTWLKREHCLRFVMVIRFSTERVVFVPFTNEEIDFVICRQSNGCPMHTAEHLYM